MKVRSLLLGLVGGVVGTALVFVVLFLLGFADVGTKTAPTPTPSSTAVATEPGTGQGLTPAEIYSQSKRGVVMVVSTFGSSSSDFGFPFGQSQVQQALGSGFVVSSDGYILTNAHVVDDQGTKATDVKVVFKGEGTTSESVDAELVGIDLESDVAALKVDPAGVKGGLTALPLGDSEQVAVGEPVVAIGNPLGYDFSLTSGIVSAVDRNLQSPVEGVIIPNGIQTDAAINQGNSGGPLIDEDGQVIGINEQIASQSGGNQGLGFAVPINTAVRSFDQLKQYGEVRYAWLGIQGQTITPDMAQAFDLPVERGVLLAKVISGGPADKAGLRGGTREATVQDQTYVVGGDIITKVDGKAVPSMEELIAIIDEYSPGEKVKVTYVRDGKTKTTDVTLEQRPSTM
jgi:S1-C subfamily serine protease